jgi:predicted nucleic acid-binding Zn ribbon protein
MLCEACLRDNAPHAKYCCECGRGLIGQPDDIVLTTGVWSDQARLCVSCQEAIPAHAQFCSECGIGAMRAARATVGARVILLAIALTFLVSAVVFVHLHFSRHTPNISAPELGAATKRRHQSARAYCCQELEQRQGDTHAQRKDPDLC